MKILIPSLSTAEFLGGGGGQKEGDVAWMRGDRLRNKYSLFRFLQVACFFKGGGRWMKYGGVLAGRLFLNTSSVYAFKKEREEEKRCEFCLGWTLDIVPFRSSAC